MTSRVAPAAIYYENSGNYSKTLKLWNLQGKLLYKLKDVNGFKEILSSPDGKFFAALTDDNRIKLYTFEGKLLCNLKTNVDEVTKLVFSPNSQSIISIGGWKDTAKLWSRSGKLIGFLGDINDVVFSPNSQTIISLEGGVKDTAKLWSRSGKLIGFLGGDINDVVFSSNSQTIASAHEDGKIKQWNLKGKLLYSFKGDLDSVKHVLYSLDGKTITSISENGAVKQWNLQGKLLYSFDVSRTDSLVFSPDGKTLLVFNENDSDVQVLNSKGEIRRTLTGHTDGVARVIFSRDSQFIAVISGNGTVELWNSNGWLLHSFPLNSDLSNLYWSVLFSPNAQTVASIGHSNTIKLLNLRQELLYSLNAHRGGVSKVIFSPNGQNIASVHDDGTTKLWNLNRELLHSFDAYDPVFSPDGKTIALTNNVKSISNDKSIKLWNLKGELLHSLNGHTDEIYSVVFSPDGQIIASVSKDKTVKLWNIKGELLVSLNGHQDWIQDMALSPDGKMIASASDDQTIKLWSLDLNDVLTRGCSWARDYLANNPNLSQEDRQVCDGI
jgi:WD40 repeat protein